MRSELPVGTYTLNEDNSGLYLSETESFTLPKKVYGTTEKYARRTLSTFASRPLLTGVLLEGEKGSGKTLLGKQISLLGLAAGYSTIIINAPFRGSAFNLFMQQITQPCVLLFDEFEKVYDGREDQQELLTFLDGTVPTKKLCVLTVNVSYSLDTNMINRPGRLFYCLAFHRLEESFIREYALDTLKNQALVEDVVKAATTFTRFNFDQLQALVEEMNRYDETPIQALQWLNIQPSRENNKTFTVELVDPKGKKLRPYQDEWAGNPVSVREGTRDFSFHYYKRNDDDDLPTGMVHFMLDDFVKAENESYWFTNEDKFTLVLRPKPPKKFKAAALGYRLDFGRHALR